MELNDNVLLSLNLADKASVVNAVPVLGGYGIDKLLSQNTFESCRIQVDADYDTPVVLKVKLPSKEPLRVVSLIKTNLTQLAQWKIVVMDREGGETLHDSGYMNVFSALDEYGTANWGDFNWGGLGSEDNFQNLNVNAVYPLPEELSSSYVELSVLTHDLAITYFECFLLWIGNGYQPEFNADYGAEISVIDDTDMRKGASGSRSYGSPIKHRQVTLELSNIHKLEFFKKLFGPIMQKSGKSTLLHVVMTPKDLDTLLFQSLVGNITNTQKATHSFWNRLNAPLDIEESP